MLGGDSTFQWTEVVSMKAKYRLIPTEAVGRELSKPTAAPAGKVRAPLSITFHKASVLPANEAAGFLHQCHALQLQPLHFASEELL
jgi:hypothetical protein